jgi:hypothetical protein
MNLKWSQTLRKRRTRNISIPRRSSTYALIFSLNMISIRTTTAKNINVLERETGGLTWRSTPGEIRKELFNKLEDIPFTDQWRLQYLTKLLEQRDMMTYNGEVAESEVRVRAKELLDSLCIN